MQQVMPELDLRWSLTVTTTLNKPVDNTNSFTSLKFKTPLSATPVVSAGRSHQNANPVTKLKKLH